MSEPIESPTPLAELAQWIEDDAAEEDEAVREFAASVAARIRALAGGAGDLLTDELVDRFLAAQDAARADRLGDGLNDPDLRRATAGDALTSVLDALAAAGRIEPELAERSDLPEGQQSKELAEEIEAAAAWFSRRFFGASSVRRRDREYARQVVEAVAPILVARVRAQVAEEIAQAIEDNVRHADEQKQDRGGFSSFTGRMAYVAGHDNAAAIVRQRAGKGLPGHAAALPDVVGTRVLDGACHSVWLHGKWRWLTSQMTTEEREAFADAVDRAGDALADGEPRLPVDRWWREPTDVVGTPEIRTGDERCSYCKTKDRDECPEEQV